MPYTIDRVPSLPKNVYGHASILREIVGRSIDYAHLHNKGFGNDVPENLSRPLRRFFDDIVAKFPNWYGRESSAVLLPEQYDGAMRLRRQCSLACRHARTYPESADAIKAFFTLVPDYIQRIVDDPDVEDPVYELIPTKVPQSPVTTKDTYWQFDTKRDGELLPGVPLILSLTYEGGSSNQYFLSCKNTRVSLSDSALRSGFDWKITQYGQTFEGRIESEQSMPPDPETDPTDPVE